ncbi:MAG: DUF1552 domain-containing protein [Myxococcaceae bacterium]|nr:DUF1552 domain-containing protein [Myxococcaceae bacterium]
MSTPRLSRRTLLRGAGAAVALPFLEAMAPRSARAQAAQAAPRFITFFIPNGFHAPLWTPPEATAAGVTTFTTTRWLQTLLTPDAGLPDLALTDLNALSGLRGTGDFDPAFNDSHGAGTVNFSTAAPGDRYRGAYGKSVDIVARDFFKARGALDTPRDSLAVAVQNFESPDWFRHYYASWAGKFQPAPTFSDPVRLYQELFAASGAAQGSADALRRTLARRKSVLDFVRSDVTRLNAQLGASDRVRLDAHLHGVRELERRLMAMSPNLCGPPPMNPYSQPSQYDAWGRYSRKAELQVELFAYAFTCDLTRFGSFLYFGGGETGGPDEGFLSQRWPQEDWQQHNQAHAIAPGQHRDGDVHYDVMNAFTAEHLKWFRVLLKKLKAATAPSGKSLLDESLVYLGSEMGYGPTHSLESFPALLAGKAGGALTGGRAFDFENRQHLGNLHVSLLQKLGVTSPRMEQDTPTSTRTLYDTPLPAL